MVLQTSLLLVLLAGLAVVADPETTQSLNGDSNQSGNGNRCKLEEFPLIVYLTVGAVGVGVVSSVISILVTYYCMKYCKGKKKKKEEEGENEDEVSMQYASLQNLAVKEGHAVKLHENEAEQKTYYASVADIRKEIQTMDDKDVDAINHPETP